MRGSKRRGRDRAQKTPGGGGRFVPFCIPATGSLELRQVGEAIRSGWLTTGPMTARFESGIRALVGARHAVAVNSCTAALHLALATAGVREGDEVVTSPYTFAATGEAILYLGARPVFADILPATLNLDPGAAERAITRRTRAIVPVHIAGLPCDMSAIRSLARRSRIAVVDDAAHALGAAIDGRPVGQLADLTCFSFYATKNLTTGEGGMVVTSSAAMADHARRLSLHGLSRDAWRRYERGGSWRYDVVELGYKYNMTDVAASLGLAQLAKFPAMQDRRRILAERYTRTLEGCEAFDLPLAPPDVTHAWHLYVIRLRPGVLRVGRDQLIAALAKDGIGTSVHFQPLHLFSYYRRTFGYRRGAFPRTERESARALSLPLHPALTRAAQDRVIEALLDRVRRHRR